MLPFALPRSSRPEDDIDSYSPESSVQELSDALARGLLRAVIAEGDDSTAFCVALHVLKAVPAVVRYLCGGVDFVRVQGGEDKEEDGGGDGGDGDRRDEPSDAGAAREHGAAAGDDSSVNSGDEEEDGDDADDDAEVAFDDWSRRRERRYISSVVLERLAAVDDAVEQLCVPRVLAHLVSVLHENGMEASGVRACVRGLFRRRPFTRVLCPQGDMLEEDSKERVLLRLSNQAVCRTLTALARSKARQAGAGACPVSMAADTHTHTTPACCARTRAWRTQAVPPAVRFNVTRAVMGLGAIPDIVAMLRDADGVDERRRDITTAEVAASTGVLRRATLGLRDFFAAGADAAPAPSGSSSVGDGSSMGGSEWGDESSGSAGGGPASVLSLVCIDDDAAGAIESAAVLLGTIMAAGSTEGAEDDPVPFSLSDEEKDMMTVCVCVCVRGWVCTCVRVCVWWFEFCAVEVSILSPVVFLGGDVLLLLYLP